MANTPRLGLRLLVAGDADNVTNMNKNLERLDILSQLILESVTVAAQPGAPTLGQAWYVPLSGVTGAEWAINTGKLALFVSNGDEADGWVFVDAPEGITAFVLDQAGGDGAELTLIAGSWVSATGTKTVNLIHPLTPSAGSTRYPLFYAATPTIIQSAVVTNQGGGAYPSDTVFPEIQYGAQLNSGATTVVIAASIISADGWGGGLGTAAQVKLFGTGALDPSAVTIPAGNWLTYSMPTVTGAPSRMSLHLTYTQS